MHILYVLLLAGDAYHGVFASMLSQLAILTFVVVVAAVLLSLFLFPVVTLLLVFAHRLLPVSTIMSSA